MGIKKNLVANYVGQAWRGAMGLIFVPLYIRYLGIESYGLIAIFAILQSSLGLLDVGMKPALSREMARFTAGEHTAQTIRDLLRSIEIISSGIALAMILGIWLASNWLATRWLSTQSVSPVAVSRALSLMGMVVALRFVESIYASVLAGLQQQVTDNLVTMTAATVRAIGVIGILAWVSPTIEAFFLWQSVVSVVSVAIYVRVVYRLLPAPAKPPSFSAKAITSIWRFAAGMTLISVLSFLLTQTDKILLSRLLTLTAFSYFALAGSVANSLYILTMPITSAFYPRFTELATRRESIALSAEYHKAAQLVSVIMGGTALIMIVFADRILQLWTADSSLSRETAPLMAILALGTMLNGFVWIPYQMQLAHGWTRLGVGVNAVAVTTLIPLLLWLVPRYGSHAAAWIWVALNAGYLVFEIYFMHRRLLKGEKGRWYRNDLLLPLASSSLTAIACRWIFPADLGRIVGILSFVVIGILVVAAGALAAPAVRRMLFLELGKLHRRFA